MPLTLDRIHAIAADAARHVCEAGSPAADKHNMRAIECAIQQAITEFTADEHKKEKQDERVLQ